MLLFPSSPNQKQAFPGRKVIGAWVLALAASIALFTGCASEAPPTDTEASAGDSLTQLRTTSTATPALRTIQTIEQEVSRRRQLPIKSEIAVSYITRDQLRQEMKKEMEKEFQQDEILSEERALKGLGLLDPSEDLAAVIEQMLGDEIAGYYDTETKQLKLVSDTPELSTMNQVTLAHEVTHALQDQNFSLNTIIPENSGNDDLDTARQALVEGDATFTEEDFTVANFSFMDMMSVLLGSVGSSGGLSGNSFIDDSLMFPYTGGLDFVAAVMERGGWSALDGVYGKPPDSTEQILHPDKYFAGEAPMSVAIPDLAAILGPDWRPGFENVIGEFELRELLSRQLPSAKANRAAAGWGGDAIRYYDGPAGSSLVIMKTEWDSEVEAAEFAESMGTALELRYDAKFDLNPSRTPVLHTGEGAWQLVQHGKTVLAVQSPDPEIGEKVMRSLS